MSKPEKLYRGVVLNLEEFINYPLFGEDIKVHYEPVIDEMGRKVVNDGNEYGVYMSSNPHMPLSVYGKVHNNATVLVNNISIDRGHLQITSPNIGIVYEIDTTGMDIRKPWMSEQLVGQANNNFEGEEWIADLIPANNYHVININIGSDLLHDEMNIKSTDNIKNLKEYVVNIIKKRDERLRLLGNELLKSPIKANLLTIYSPEMQIYRSIFKIGGLIDSPIHDTSTKNGIIDYLMQKIYDKDRNNIDLTSLKYIYNLLFKLQDVPDNEIIAVIIELLKRDKNKKLVKIEELAVEAKKEGREFNSLNILKTINLIDELIQILNSLYNVSKDDYKDNKTL